MVPRHWVLRRTYSSDDNHLPPQKKKKKTYYTAQDRNQTNSHPNIMRNNMPNEDHQTFYSLPHSPRTIFLSIGCAATSYILTNNLTKPLSPLMHNIFNFIRAASLSIILSSCVYAVIFDPETAYTTERLVEGNGKRGCAITAKRPLIGLEGYKYHQKTPEHLKDVWVDGVRHEKALVRIG